MTGPSRTAPTDDLEELYRDLHRHPELSFQEVRTAGAVADRPAAAGFRVQTGIGRTGVVGVLTNGAGPTVLLRADMHTVPVQEETGLRYASTARAGRDDRPGEDTVPVSPAPAGTIALRPGPSCRHPRCRRACESTRRRRQ